MTIRFRYEDDDRAAPEREADRTCEITARQIAELYDTLPDVRKCPGPFRLLVKAGKVIGVAYCAEDLSEGTCADLREKENV